MVHPWGYNKRVDIPTREALSKAFADLGTQKEVARFYAVSRATVLKWERKLSMNVESHREIPRAKAVVRLLSDVKDRVRIAQWLCDEGTISTSYDLGDNTYLAVGGSMVDGYVLEEIGRIVNERVNNLTKSPRLGWMPMRYVRLHSAEAYSLLSCIRSELLGLKQFEAEAALRYFPPCGYVHGRHSTDEFMLAAWRKYAQGVVSGWNVMKKVPLAVGEVNKMIESWIDSRVRRSRYFRDGA